MNAKKTIPKKENRLKSTKVFKPLTTQQLESVIGGPISSRGTETNVQPGTG